MTPLAGTAGFRLDPDSARAVVRPSGTEPLLKVYTEAWTGPRPSGAERAAAAERLEALAAEVLRAASSPRG